MKNLHTLAEQLKITPKLRLGIKVIQPNGKPGGVKSTGPHKVKFLEEPTTIMGKDENGAPRKELKFVIEEKGIKYHWQTPILGKDGQPSYLIERLMNIEVGDERILELCKQNGRNYVDVRMIDEASEPPEDEEPVIQMEDEDADKHL